MLVIKDRKKVEFVFALLCFVFVALLFDFFLSKTKTNGVWEWFFSSIVFFLAVPTVLIGFVLKEKLKDQYLSFSFTAKTVLLSILGLIFYVAMVWVFVVYLDWKQYLGVSNWVLGSMGFLLFVDLVLTPFVLFSREFFFRNYLLKTATPVLGALGAILFQACLSAVLDLYLTGFAIAWQQLVLVFFLYCLLGYLAWLNKSVIVSFLVSWVYLIVVDLFFIYQIANSVG